MKIVVNDNDKKIFWYISLSPDIINDQRLIALKKAGKAYLVSAIYDIILHAVRQPQKGYIEYIPQYHSIEDQLAEILHYPQSQIIETLETFEPIGWIMPISKQDMLLAGLFSPVYPSFTYEKTGASIRKAEARFKLGKPTKGYFPTIDEALSWTYGRNFPDICPQYKSKSIDSSSLLSTQGNSYTTNSVSTSDNKSLFKDIEEKDLTASEIALLKEAKWDFKILNDTAKIYEDNSKTAGDRLSRVKKNLFYVSKKYFGKNKPNDLGAYLYSAICGNYQV